MNRNNNKTSRESIPSQGKARYPIHPYFTSNSPEETIRRMGGVKERIEKFKEKLDADREANKS